MTEEKGGQMAQRVEAQICIQEPQVPSPTYGLLSTARRDLKALSQEQHLSTTGYGPKVRQINKQKPKRNKKNEKKNKR